MRQSEKKGEICTAAYQSSVSRARCQKHALLALQPVLRVRACLCGHRALWHRVRSLSQAEGAPFGTISCFPPGVSPGANCCASCALVSSQRKEVYSLRKEPGKAL